MWWALNGARANATPQNCSTIDERKKEKWNEYTSPPSYIRSYTLEKGNDLVPASRSIPTGVEKSSQIRFIRPNTDVLICMYTLVAADLIFTIFFSLFKKMQISIVACKVNSYSIFLVSQSEKWRSCSSSRARSLVLSKLNFLFFKFSDSFEIRKEKRIPAAQMRMALLAAFRHLAKIF